MINRIYGGSRSGPHRDASKGEIIFSYIVLAIIAIVVLSFIGYGIYSVIGYVRKKNS